MFFTGFLLWFSFLHLQLQGSAESVWDFIPQNTDFILYVQPDLLFKHPALSRIREAGEIRRLKKDLAVFPWKTPADKSWPDLIYTFFSGTRNHSILLDTGKNIEEMYRDLEKKYASEKNIRIQKGRKDHFQLIRLIFLRPGKRDGDRIYDLVYLSPHIAVYTNYRNRMQWDRWEKPYSAGSAEKLRKSHTKQNIASGFSDNPGRILLDPTGTLRRLKSFDFCFSTDAGQQQIRLLCTAYCRSSEPQNVERTALQMSSYLKILLVAFFGSDPELFKALTNHCKVSVDGEKIRLESQLDSETLAAMRQYYKNHAGDMNQGIQQHLKSGKDGTGSRTEKP